jgi:hypothetical protein
VPPPSDVDRLLDGSFVDLSKIIDERNNEIKLLKAELDQARNELLESRLGTANVATQRVASQYQSLQENSVAIYSHLKVANLTPPTMSSVDTYVATLRSIIDRSKQH